MRAKRKSQPDARDVLFLRCRLNFATVKSRAIVPAASARFSSAFCRTTVRKLCSTVSLRVRVPRISFAFATNTSSTSKIVFIDTRIRLAELFQFGVCPPQLQLAPSVPDSNALPSEVMANSVNVTETPSVHRSITARNTWIENIPLVFELNSSKQFLDDRSAIVAIRHDDCAITL